MNEQRRTWLKRLMILPPIAIGVVVFVLLAGGRAPPTVAPPQETAVPVRVIEVQPVQFVPWALGYGHVEPGAVWHAVAEVGGKVIERNPRLERGRLMFAGEVLLRIDPADYELAIARTDANLESIDAQLSEWEIQQANTEMSLAIERRGLDLLEEDLERKNRLFRNGNISEASVEDAEREVLVQSQRVQDLENQLNLLPAQRAVLEASRRLTLAQRDEAALDLERTVIRLPFDARIAEVDVEPTQFVNVGEVLAVADGIAVAEVNAQVPLDRMRPLIPTTLDLAALTQEQLSDLPGRLGLDAVVRLRIGDFEAEWPARVDRISETIDPQTRTMGVFVAVDDPFRQIDPGIRPPLTKNMFVEVELRGEPRDGVLVVPRAAVYGTLDGSHHVFIADDQDRLERRAVVTDTPQGDTAVVRDGLQPGERVVVSDLIPAIEGMKLDPALDERVQDSLVASATGEDRR